MPTQIRRIPVISRGSKGGYKWEDATRDILNNYIGLMFTGIERRLMQEQIKQKQDWWMTQFDMNQKAKSDEEKEALTRTTFQAMLKERADMYQKARSNPETFKRLSAGLEGSDKRIDKFVKEHELAPVLGSYWKDYKINFAQMTAGTLMDYEKVDKMDKYKTRALAKRGVNPYEVGSTAAEQAFKGLVIETQSAVNTLEKQRALIQQGVDGLAREVQGETDSTKRIAAEKKLALAQRNLLAVNTQLFGAQNELNTLSPFAVEEAWTQYQDANAAKDMSMHPEKYQAFEAAMVEPSGPMRDLTVSGRPAAPTAFDAATRPRETRGEQLTGRIRDIGETARKWNPLTAGPRAAGNLAGRAYAAGEQWWTSPVESDVIE